MSHPNYNLFDSKEEAVMRVVREAIDASLAQIVGTIKDTIEETPPELVAGYGAGRAHAGYRPGRY